LHSFATGDVGPDADASCVAVALVSHEALASPQAIAGRDAPLSAPSRARGVADEMPVRQRRQVCVGRRGPPPAAGSRL